MVVAEVVTTLVVSLVLGLAQIVMPEESEHKRDLLLAWIRHRECRGKVQVPRPARRIIRTGSVGDPRDRKRGLHHSHRPAAALQALVSRADRHSLAATPRTQFTWVAERWLAWIMHAHRHARDYERLVQHSENLSPWAAITLMTRRLTQGKKSLALLPPVQAA